MQCEREKGDTNAMITDARQAFDLPAWLKLSDIWLAV
jgi:hypothetical protein